MTDEQLFLGLLESELWLHRSDPDCARREGDEPQVNEVIERIRAKG